VLLALRRVAIWLLPIGGIGTIVFFSSSLALASLFAVLWTVGLAALLTDLTVRWHVARGARRDWT
jgi:dolichol kinase